MKFSLTVDMDILAGDPQQELSRILRYWAGNLKHYELTGGTHETISDSAYTAVGTWRIESGGPAV
jgi:hypothetical protein